MTKAARRGAGPATSGKVRKANLRPVRTWQWRRLGDFDLSDSSSGSTVNRLQSPTCEGLATTAIVHTFRLQPASELFFCTLFEPRFFAASHL
jgi:hypothetical protein